MNKVQVKILIKDEDSEYIPTYATKYSSGADLKAKIDSDINLLPGHTALVPTGIFLEIPNGFEVQIRPRSGLALNNKITVLNTPGTIDSDYTGEIKVILINHDSKLFVIKPKMKIAQMIIVPVYQAEFIKSPTEFENQTKFKNQTKFVKGQKLDSSIRGEGGFGHTGNY